MLQKSPLQRGLQEPSSFHAGGRADLVELDPDHPGFRDEAYRARRNAIAQMALDYNEGQEVPEAPYSEAEHKLWQDVWANLAPLHTRYACTEYLETAHELALNSPRIPQLKEINAVLEPASGFQMLPVAGLVSGQSFLSYLGRKIFLSTQYIRHHSMPLYTPEPDVVHELVGHAATFLSPAFTQLNILFGKAAREADEHFALQLERLYWYTLEFGLVKEGAEVKAYGAGLLSSFGELGRFDKEAELRPFSIDTVIAIDYDPTNYQDQLFVIDSFESLIAQLSDWLERRTAD